MPVPHRYCGKTNFGVWKRLLNNYFLFRNYGGLDEPKIAFSISLLDEPLLSIAINQEFETFECFLDSIERILPNRDVGIAASKRFLAGFFLRTGSFLDFFSTALAHLNNTGWNEVAKIDWIVEHISPKFYIF
jgi:hypothetical protein